MHEAARDGWGNPSSVHAEGRAARTHVEAARAAVAELASCDVREVWLTGGGTEANNLALRSFFADARGCLLHEPSRAPVGHARGRGAASERSRDRHVGARSRRWADRPGRFAHALAATGHERVLIALQAVNHETGVVQPVREVIALAGARTHAETRVHVDAVQAWGRLGDVGAGADSRSLAAHKLRGPKGIGALVTREGMILRPLLVGGAQERGARPGTIDPRRGRRPRCRRSVRLLVERALRIPRRAARQARARAARSGTRRARQRRWHPGRTT